MYLASAIVCHEYVPCSQVSVHEAFLGEVVHTERHLLTAVKQHVGKVTVNTALGSTAQKTTFAHMLRYSQAKVHDEGGGVGNGIMYRSVLQFQQGRPRG